MPGLCYANLDPSMPPLLEPQPPLDANLVLTFPADVNIAGTSIELIDVHNRRIATERPEPGDNKTDVNLPLKAPLAPGVYIVKWRALSVDGRERQGSYSFNVDP
jgi:methionine-rich copper-binding protein CopC